MSSASPTLAERYAELIETILDSFDADVGIAVKKGFGSSSLTVNGKIFAMLIRDRLVVKLPRGRVDALIASRDGERFDPGHGRLMKDWASIEPESKRDWLELANEAMTFVSAKR